MESGVKIDKIVNLTFTLSLIQRIFNPFERLLVVLITIFMYGRVITLLITHLSIESLLVTLFILILLTVVFFLRFVLSFYKEVFLNKYPNTISIEDGVLSYGFNSFDDNEMYVFHYRKMVVTKGFFKTYIVKEVDTGQGLGLTLPQNIISYEYLKNIIEKNN